MSDTHAADLLARMKQQMVNFNPLEDHADPSAKTEKIAFVPVSLWNELAAFIAKA